MNKYCIYLHHDLNGCVFYVGSGTLSRATRKQPKTRSVEHLNKVKELDNNYYTFIVYKNLSKKDSILKEQQLYDIYVGTGLLTNKRRPAGVKELDVDFLSELLYLCPTSPSGLRWKVDRKCGKRYNIVKVKTGDVAGTIANTGYYCVNINYTIYIAHRIIYLLSHGSIDSDKVVDHIDRNKLNNSISNLRLVSHTENSRNLSSRCDNELPMGISFSVQRNRYRAYVNIDGKQISKSFSCNVLGKEQAYKLAIDARNRLVAEYFT